ncbi:hypothetical protein PR048_011893 [Dryococelus australis]|uniref:Uncharacterized protein n=1 Tax=Dryococelus australis TaxID=614101 RepID=A0ABQ9HN34_9NEOP|nr:hypothetical protein PR048_011893 [Dryococelus australis]
MPVQRAWYIHDRNRHPINKLAIELPHGINTASYLTLTCFAGFQIRVEEFHNPTGPAQYSCCQWFNHVAAGCNAPPRCMYCSGPHRTKDCQIVEDTTQVAKPTKLRNGAALRLKQGKLGSSSHEQQFLENNHAAAWQQPFTPWQQPAQGQAPPVPQQTHQPAPVPVYNTYAWLQDGIVFPALANQPIPHNPNARWGKKTQAKFGYKGV